MLEYFLKLRGKCCMEGIKGNFFEEILFDSMLKSSGNMIETLTSVTQFLDKFVVIDGPILPIIRSLKNDSLREKAMKYYNHSILEIQNTARFYSSISSFLNESVFKSNDLSLKDLKVSRIIEIGISLEKIVETYDQLNEKTLLKKKLTPMIQDILKVISILERLITLLKPVLRNDRTIFESIVLLKDEKLKKDALNYCDLCNQTVKKLAKRYPYFETPFYDSCEAISNKDPEKITFNILSQWKSTLIAHQEGLKIKKFDVLSKKKEETKKIVFDDLLKIYSIYHELDLNKTKNITGNEIRSLLEKTEALSVLFEKKYKEFQTDYFELGDYHYILESLKKIKNCLNKILDFPLMAFVSSQSILKYYKKTSLKRSDKKEIVILIKELKSLSNSFSSNIEKGLEVNNIIKINQKKEKFKKKKQNEKIKIPFSDWLFNKESGFDEKVCGSNKLVRDHIHEYKEISRKEVDCHNCFKKVLITKTCEACGKVENFEKIQLNDYFLDLIKRNIFKKIDLNIVELKKLFPRIEAQDRKLKELIKRTLDALKSDQEKDEWYENEHIYFDEPAFRAFVEKPNKINQSNYNFREPFLESQPIMNYEFYKNIEYPFTSVDGLVSESLKKKLDQDWSSWLFEVVPRDSLINTLPDSEYVNTDNTCFKR